MTILQIDSLTTNQSVIDNFVWPFILFIFVTIGTFFWNYIFKKTFKIIINSNNTFVGQHNNESYLIINVSLINETKDDINELTLTINNNIALTVKDKVSTLSVSRRPAPNVTLGPTFNNLVDNVILNVPLKINSNSTVKGNIVIDFNIPLVDDVELSFNYLDKHIVKKIITTNLVRRNL